MFAAHRRRWGVIKSIVIVMLLVVFAATLLAPSASAWAPQPLNQVNIREYKDTDDGGWNDLHFNSYTGLARPIPFWQILIDWFFFQTTVVQPSATEEKVQNDADNLTPPSVGAGTGSN